MNASKALDAIDALIQADAELAQTFAAAAPGFDRIGAGTGVGIRLKALQDAKAAIVQAGLKHYELQE